MKRFFLPLAIVFIFASCDIQPMIEQETSLIGTWEDTWDIVHDGENFTSTHRIVFTENEFHEVIDQYGIRVDADSSRTIVQHLTKQQGVYRIENDTIIFSYKIFNGEIINSENVDTTVEVLFSMTTNSLTLTFPRWSATFTRID